MWTRKGTVDGTRNWNEEDAIAVFGGGFDGLAVADHLAEADASVSFYDGNPAALRRAGEDVTTGQTALDDADSLACTDASEAGLSVVAGHLDRRNVLTAQLLRTVVGVEDVLLRVNDPDYVDSFEKMGVDTVCPSSDVPDEICAAIERLLPRTERT